MSDICTELPIRVHWVVENEASPASLHFITERSIALQMELAQPFESQHALTLVLSDVTATENHYPFSVKFAVERSTPLQMELAQPFESQHALTLVLSDVTATENHYPFSVKFAVERSTPLQMELAQPFESQHALTLVLSDVTATENHYPFSVKFAVERSTPLQMELAQPFESQHALTLVLSDVTATENHYPFSVKFAVERSTPLQMELAQPFESQHALTLVLSDVTATENHYPFSVKFVVERSIALQMELAQPFESQHALTLVLSDVTATENHYPFSVKFAVERSTPLQMELAQPFESHLPISVLFKNPVESHFPITVEWQEVFHFESQLPLTLRIGRTPSIIIVASHEMWYQGRKIAVLKIDGLTINHANFAWSGTVTLAHWSDFKTLRNGSDFDLILQGDTYRLMVNDYGINRTSSPKLDLSVSCVSPTVRLDDDSYDKVNNRWKNKRPTEIIAELLPPEYRLDWQTDDSPIVQYTASSESIMGVIRKLAERVGAIVQTQKDGYTIKVYPLYRVKPEAWQDLTLPMTHQFTRGSLEMQLRWGKIKRWNSVIIGDEESNPDCSMEVVDNNTKLRLYPVPFREMDVATTRLSGVFIGHLVYREAVMCERDLEIKEGKVSVKYPIYQLLRWRWKENFDLGIPEYSIDSKELSLSVDNQFSGHSVIDVEYIYRFWEAPIGQPKDVTVQYLALEKV